MKTVSAKIGKSLLQLKIVLKDAALKDFSKDPDADWRIE